MSLQSRKPAKVNFWTEQMRACLFSYNRNWFYYLAPWSSGSLLTETARDTRTNRRRNHIPPWSLDSSIFVTNEVRWVQIQLSIWFYVKTVITFYSVQHLTLPYTFRVSRVQAISNYSSSFEIKWIVEFFTTYKCVCLNRLLNVTCQSEFCFSLI